MSSFEQFRLGAGSAAGSGRILPGDAVNPEHVLEAFSDREIIAALQRLPEEIRWTLLLVDVQGWIMRMRPKCSKLPVGTVKSRAHRGRNVLREILRPMAARRQYDKQ